MRSLIRNHPTLSFFVLAFALSWYPHVLGLLGVRASGINPLGVLVAGLIVPACERGWAGAKALLARIFRWRAGWQAYAVAFGLPLALLAIALAANIALGAPPPTREALARWPDVVDSFLGMVLFVGLGEEPGWRGAALPLLYRRFSPRAAALVLGAIWALWHVPLMGTEFAWAEVPCFVASVFAASVVLAWLYNLSGESVLLCMLMHATVNAVGAGYVFRFFGGADRARFWWIYAPLWVGAAAVIAWRAGATLGVRRGERAPASSKALGVAYKGA